MGPVIISYFNQIYCTACIACSCFYFLMKWTNHCISLGKNHLKTKLDISFFSFYPLPRALKPVVCCLREEWMMDLLHDDVVYLVGMSRYFPLTVVNESICGHARGTTQRRASLSLY